MTNDIIGSLICKVKDHDKELLPDEIVKEFGWDGGSICKRCQFVVRHYNYHDTK